MCSAEYADADSSIVEYASVQIIPVQSACRACYAMVECLRLQSTSM